MHMKGGLLASCYRLPERIHPKGHLFHKELHALSTPAAAGKDANGASTPTTAGIVLRLGTRLQERQSCSTTCFDFSSEITKGLARLSFIQGSSSGVRQRIPGAALRV